MSPDRPESLTPEEARAREAVRSLGVPAADPAFRARLQRDFVAGRIGERRVLTLPVPWYRRPALRLALVPATFAALAALAVAVLSVTDRGPGWTLMMARGDGSVTVDGAPVSLASRADLTRALHPGARVSVPANAELELMSAAGLVVQVTEGTELTLPATPGRWMNRHVTGRIHHGEIRVTTGSAFAGAHLQVRTPEATVEVTGTTLAVICEPTGTCVCVQSGVVKVGARGGRMEAVPEGRRRYVFNDGRPPESAEIRPTEGVALGEFRDSRSRWLENQPR